MKIDASLYTILQVLSLTLFEQTPLHQIGTDSDYNSVQPETSNQWNIFD
jgi:hypothetical protein